MDDYKTSVSSKHKNGRKQRIVKNAYVDIDSVTVDPGTNYCNWIQITKEKLKEREIQMFRVALNRIQSIVNKEINKTVLFTIRKEIMDNTLNKLYAEIDCWKGLTISRRKSPINRYRDYFVVARGWYNKKRKNLFGDLFWIHILNDIHKIASDKMLETNILRALINGKVYYNNTKPTALITGGVLMCSNDINNYFANFDETLQIKQWIKEQEMCGNWTKKAEAITMQLQSQLEIIIESYVTFKQIKKENDVLPQIRPPIFNTDNINNMDRSYRSIRGASQPTDAQSSFTKYSPMNGNKIYSNLMNIASKDPMF